MTSRILTTEEIEQLTGYRRWNAQARALESMGVRYFRRPDGCPVVVDEALTADGGPMQTKPNFDALAK